MFADTAHVTNVRIIIIVIIMISGRLAKQADGQLIGV